MGKVLLKHARGCLLILLLGFQSYSEGYLGLQRLNDNTMEYFYNVSSCYNIPIKFKGSSEWARTDQCILLFAKENCQGTVYHLFPGFHRNLMEFIDRTLSFRSCSLSEMENEYTNPETIFYASDYNDTIAFKTPNSCQNLRFTYVEWGVDSVKTETCILLFKEESCNGEYYRAFAGHNFVLGSYKKKTKSFKPCTKDTSKIEYHTKFYRNSNFSDIVDDINLHPGCNKDIFLGFTTYSIESEACVRLFTDFDCSGNSFKIEAGRHTSSSHPNLPIEDIGVNSLRACNEDYHGGPSQNPLKYDVAFSKIFQDGFSEYFEYERISTICQNIHWSYVKKANSVETKRCILLYENENCKGIPYKVHTGQHDSLGDFNGKLVSFKACSKYDNEIEHHVKVYLNSDYTGLVDDIDVYEGCNRADLRASFQSIDTPICLDLYSNEDCADGHSYEIQPGQHSANAKTIKSFRPCNSSDVSRFLNETRPFKLKATILHFEITSDETTVQQLTKTSFGEMGHRNVFRNDGPAVQTQRFTVQKTISDRIDMEKIKGFSKMSEVSVSDSATKDFTSGFRSSLNTGFRETKSHGNSSSSTRGSESGSSSTAGGSISAGGGMFGWSVNVGGHYSRTNHDNTHQSQTSGSHQEYSKEESVFATEEKNVEQRIGAALTSGHRNTGEESTSSVGRYSKEESRTFTIDQTITVNPCTEYDVTSLVKKTENFPVTYTTFANITGFYTDDGSKLTAEEIKPRLTDLDVADIADDFTVIAKGSARLKMDFSWYSVLSGKGKIIENCQDGTDSNAQLPGIEFYAMPHFVKSLLKTKVTGFCQVLPYKVWDRVQSVYSSSCVILFPTESCRIDDQMNNNVGYTLLVHPNQGQTLPHFANASRSFQSCEGYAAHSLNEGRIKFYSDNSNHAELLVDVPLTSQCKELPNIAIGNVSSVANSNCVILFSEPKCTGKNFTVRPFSAMKLKDHFDKQASSFRLCNELDETGNNFTFGDIKFYENKNKNNLLVHSTILQSCQNLLYQNWDKAVSVETEACTILYDQPFCQGSSVIVQPGNELPELFKKSLKSFVACDHEDEDISGERGLESGGIKDVKTDEFKKLQNLLQKICSTNGGHYLCPD